MLEKSKPRNVIELISILKQNNVSEAEYKKYYNRFLEDKARQKSIPLQGTFELTPLCNLNCKMCYVHLTPQQFDNRSLLSVQEWKDLMKQAHKAGMLKAALTGGECLTYPGFDDLYLFLYDMGVVPTIMSNGVLINKSKIDFFKKRPPKGFQITLYGSSNDAYEKVTGYRVFNTVYDNLCNIKEAGFNVYLTITPNAFMKEDIQEILKVAYDLQIPFNINSSLIAPRDNTGRTLHDLSIDDYVEIYRMREELYDMDSFVPVDPKELPEENHSGPKKFGLLCGGGRSAFTIQSDGGMSPCSSLYFIKSKPLEVGFSRAWEELNSMVKSFPMPEECEGCAYQRYCLLCPAIHYNSHSIGHCDPRICKRTKRLVQEGIIKL